MCKDVNDTLIFDHDVIDQAARWRLRQGTSLVDKGFRLGPVLGWTSSPSDHQDIKLNSSKLDDLVLLYFTLNR